jgi:putative exosortase-associated protein (TIGR04073 family)
MKKIICFFTIFAQFVLISSYAGAQTKEASSKAEPQQVAPSAGQMDAEVSTTQVQKQQEPSQVSQEEQSTVVLRERTSDQNPLRKVARGAVNTTLGWVEIPRQMIKVNKEKGDIAGVFWGPLKGFAFFVGRTAVGIYEVTTFLIPPYKPVVNPEFILSEEDDK